MLIEVTLHSGIRLQRVLTARVPILKSVVVGRTPFKFDMCVNRPLGYYNSMLIRTYLDLDYRARPLALVLKTWAKSSEILNNNLALTSYALYLMLIFYLQTKSVLPVLQDSKEVHLVKGCNCYFGNGADWKTNNSENVAQLLLGFFEYYSYFDYAEKAVCVRLGKPVLKSQTQLDASQCICVEDPFEIGMNFTKFSSLTQNRFQLLEVN